MAVLKRNMLFKDLGDEHLNAVVDSMYKCEFNADDVVIQQGDDGDAFYVIQSGEFGVWKDAEDGKGSQRVGTIPSGGSFGELALMYNMPRAATIKAVGMGPHVCWATDRHTFRSVLMECFTEQRARYEGFLDNVPLFRETMEDYDRARLSDAFEAREYNDGDYVVRQGDEGDAFYVIESGEALVIKNDQEVNELTLGNYFGELALLTHEPRAASVVASGRLKVARLSADAFERLIPAAVRHRMQAEAKAYSGPVPAPSVIRRRAGVSASMDEYDRARLSDAFEAREYADGAVVVRQGDEGDAFFVIESGDAIVLKNDEEVNLLSSGNYFGELALLAHEPRAASVVANGKLKVACLSAEAFERLIPDNVRASMRLEAGSYTKSASPQLQELRRAGRRVGVSAEADQFSDRTATASRVYHDKELEDIEAITLVLKRNLLFKDLDQEHLSAVIDSMYKCEFNDEDVVIQQGDDGDAFYVIQSGDFGVWKDMEDGHGASRVGTVPSGGSFGELALMYGSPRAATIKAVGTGPHVCWATDRQTFRSVLMECFTEQRARYEGFLDNVPLFRESMQAYDRARLSDAFEAREYADGEYVVRQGDEGDAFYVIESGDASVVKNDTEVNLLTIGNYFGELALLTKEPRAASVVASGRLKVARLTADSFERLIPTELRASMQREAKAYTSTRLDHAQQRRRVGVSAETDRDAEGAAAAVRPVVPKSDSERTQIAAVLSRNILFKDLAEEHVNAVIDSMRKLQFNPGDVVIQQGDDGDLFYVVQEGSFPVYKDNNDGRGPVQVTIISAGGSFGELALMYNMPRAATVKAGNSGAHVCWATDRSTFRNVLMTCFTEQRAKHEGFLDQVALFKANMEAYDRSRLTEAFESREYADGEFVVKQGEKGDAFYVIEAGEAVVMKSARTVNVLKVGNYFGELALLTQAPRAASVVARGKLKVARLSADAFERLIPDRVRHTMQEAARTTY
eukprot:TRINITY_DN160_c0_g1_i2.p1 TRINITY_DN160_c0_g1~~TRINITY_DN160_c0_g1_i2.p1  ORF type:complete len:1135 (+),score=246.60 TRINITY_DN160_c0_g1_i2:490-3405(+)